jgi:hypothetical protein
MTESRTSLVMSEIVIGYDRYEKIRIEEWEWGYRDRNVTRSA